MSQSDNTIQLTKNQKEFIKINLPQLFKRKLKYSPFRILEAIFYLIKTGCQWSLLPKEYPKWRCVYNHYRSWNERGWMEQLLDILVKEERGRRNGRSHPTVGVIDSQCVKWGVIDSEKGIDGFKKVKGIKRHIVTDTQGNLLSIYVTKGNVHDSKAAYPLIGKTLAKWQGIQVLKADKGYIWDLQQILKSVFSVDLQCVKSNFGTPDFIPAKGRWGVERTFSWFDIYRRLNRNYEKLLKCSAYVVIMAFIAFLLKHIR